MKEIGIYIHIPFCKSKCYYCDFISFANKEEFIDKYIEALKKEINNRSSDEYLVKTIYIGGGTPSIIPAKYIEEILATIENNYEIDDNAEITIEVNPGTVDTKKLNEYYKSGINRLSIGLQTSNNALLKIIGRIHTCDQFEKTVKEAQKVGFKNINADMIVDLPNQTIYDVENTINKLLELNIQHISVYSLIVEDGTKIKKLIDKGELNIPDDEMERYMYWFSKRKLEQNGYVHYEISNFAKPGYYSRHNVDCWNQKEYLGFGVAAASYENKVRYINTKCLESYIRNINNEESYKNIKIEEKQNEKSEMDEYMMLGLRKIRGISIEKFKSKFNQDPLYVYRNALTKLLTEKLVIIDTDNIKLSKKGLDLANIVWEEFV